MRPLAVQGIPVIWPVKRLYVCCAVWNNNLSTTKSPSVARYHLSTLMALVGFALLSAVARQACFLDLRSKIELKVEI